MTVAAIVTVAWSIRVGIDIRRASIMRVSAISVTVSSVSIMIVSVSGVGIMSVASSVRMVVLNVFHSCSGAGPVAILLLVRGMTLMTSAIRFIASHRPFFLVPTLRLDIAHNFVGFSVFE